MLDATPKISFAISKLGIAAVAEVGTVAEAIVETAAVPIPVRVPAAATRGRQHRKPLW